MYSIKNIKKFVDEHPEFFTDSRVAKEVIRKAEQVSANGMINPQSLFDIFEDADAIAWFDYEIEQNKEHKQIISELGKKIRNGPHHC